MNPAFALAVIGFMMIATGPVMMAGPDARDPGDRLGLALLIGGIVVLLLVAVERLAS